VTKTASAGKATIPGPCAAVPNHGQSTSANPTSASINPPHPAAIARAVSGQAVRAVNRHTSAQPSTENGKAIA
jgi:hypothetical protein